MPNALGLSKSQNYISDNVYKDSDFSHSVRKHIYEYICHQPTTKRKEQKRDMEICRLAIMESGLRLWVITMYGKEKKRKKKNQEVNWVSELSCIILIRISLCVNICQNFCMNYLRVKLMNYSALSFKERVKMLSYTSPHFHFLNVSLFMVSKMWDS